MQKLYLILLVFAITLFSCGKDKSAAPDTWPTSTGTNTIYYVVDGTAHKLKGIRDGFFTTQGVNYYITGSTGEHYMNVSSFNRQNVLYDDIELYVQADPPILNTRYRVSANGSYRSSYKKDEEMYYADSERSFVIFTRYDNNILSGQFNFYGYNKDSSHTIQLDNGWFDIRKQN